MRYLLRPVLASEIDLVYHWRNEPRVRAVMPFHSELDPGYHRSWWPKALTDPERRMLILEDQGCPSAMLVFLEVKPRISASWGLYTAPHGEIGRGKALTAWIACDFAGLRYAFEILNVETLHCEIIATHAAALKLRDRMGFTRTGARQIAPGRAPFVAMQFRRAQYAAAAWPHPFDERNELAIEADPRDR